MQIPLGPEQSRTERIALGITVGADRNLVRARRAMLPWLLRSRTLQYQVATVPRRK